MRSKLANLIKTRRKALNLSQKELAEGICTQTIISRLEKSEVNPSVDIFFKIVKKLNISMEEVAKLFDVDAMKNNNILNHEQIYELLYKRDYKTISIIVSNLNIYSISDDDYLYINWLKALLTYHIDNNLELSIKKLKNILSKCKQGTLLYCMILNTLGNLYSEKENYGESIKYFEMIIPYLNVIQNTDAEQNFYYGIARVYAATDNLTDATKWNSLAISKLLEEKSFYMLGDNYYLQSYILTKQKLFSNAIDSCTKAVNFFELEHNEQMKFMVLSHLSYLKGEESNEKK